MNEDASSSAGIKIEPSDGGINSTHIVEMVGRMRRSRMAPIDPPAIQNAPPAVLFPTLTGEHFGRSLKWAKTYVNPVQEQIRLKTSYLAPMSQEALDECLRQTREANRARLKREAEEKVTEFLGFKIHLADPMEKPKYIYAVDGAYREIKIVAYLAE